MNQKEVNFKKWCAECQYKDQEETKDPCNDCLAQGWNEDSTKPIYWKKKED